MDNRETLTLDQWSARIGQEIGVSSWLTVTQQMVDGFADLTNDHQWIHVDVPRATAETSYGGTIAHGLLVLSLLSTMAYEALPKRAGQAMGLNYGFDRVRFASPVRTGARVRGRFVLNDITWRSEKNVLFHYGVTVEIEGETKPAIVADWLGMGVMT